MRQFDNAMKQGSHYLVDLDGTHFKPFLDNHVATANYLISPHQFDEAPMSLAADRIFHSNYSIWESMNYERVRSEKHVILDSFFVFDWFPRSPGLFYTRRGRDAQRSFESVQDGMLISKSSGKASMLDGGVGNIRLKSVQIEDTAYYLVSASSSGTCHEGFPVAIPAHEYEQCMDEIEEYGYIIRTLVGKLKFVPERLVSLYEVGHEIPLLYLMVEEIRPAANAKSRNMGSPTVSVAVSFLRDSEGPDRIYASCASFDPRNLRSLQEKVEWMQRNAEKGNYKGQAITDFDEKHAYFPSVPFSLKKVMGLSLSKAEVANTMQRLGVDGATQMFEGFKKMKMLSLSVEEFMEQKFEARLNGLGTATPSKI